MWTLVINYQNKEIDFSKPWSRISMKDIVKKYTGIDLIPSVEIYNDKQAVKSINVEISSKINTIGRLFK